MDCEINPDYGTPMKEENDNFGISTRKYPDLNLVIAPRHPRGLKREEMPRSKK
jgi:hypothetical protein